MTEGSLFEKRGGRCAPLNEKERYQIRNLNASNPKLTGAGIKTILGLPHSPKTITNYLAVVRDNEGIAPPVLHEAQGVRKPHNPLNDHLMFSPVPLAKPSLQDSEERAERCARAALTGLLVNPNVPLHDHEVLARMAWDMGWAMEEEYAKRHEAHHRTPFDKTIGEGAQ